MKSKITETYNRFAQDMRTDKGPHSRDCKVCGVKAGERCRRINGKWISDVLERPHRKR
jgi:hypothetical protein